MKMANRFSFPLPLALIIGSCCVSSAVLGDWATDDDFYPGKEESPFFSMASSPQSESMPAPQAAQSSRWGIDFFGEFLYWQAKEEGLYYALPSLNNTPSPPFAQSDNSKGVKGTVARVQPEYHPGFRIGACFQRDPDQWDIRFAWTSYEGENSSSAHATPPKVLFPFWLNNNNSPIPQKAKAKWRVELDAIDLTLGKSVYTGQFLSLKPFAGFQAAWIEQNLNVKYEDVTIVTNPTMFTPSILSKNRNNSQNYGIIVGMDGKWEVGFGFSLLGRFAASLLWSHIETHQFERNDNHTPRSLLKDQIKVVTPVFDLFAGASWDKTFASGRYLVSIYAGWEEQVWRKQNQLHRYTDQLYIGNTQNVQGDLTFSGWTMGATVGF
jgi:hypothetical protein